MPAIEKQGLLEEEDERERLSRSRRSLRRLLAGLGSARARSPSGPRRTATSPAAIGPQSRLSQRPAALGDRDGAAAARVAAASGRAVGRRATAWTPPKKRCGSRQRTTS